MWQKIRVSILLYVLIMVAIGTWWSMQRTTNWQRTLPVLVHPINGDGSARVENYLDRLDDETFLPIQEFFAAQGQRYGLDGEEPFEVFLGSTLVQGPSLRPKSRNPLAAIWWSLQLRYFSWRMSSTEPAVIRIFVRFYDPKTSPRLGHSTGLQKGLVGVVNAFASRKYRGSNNVILAHELLHTVGASDKYNPDGYPQYPNGFAKPDKSPLLPQRRAEIVGGRIPKTSTEAVIPKSLKQVVIGEATAQEIKWVGQ